MADCVRVNPHVKIVLVLTPTSQVEIAGFKIWIKIYFMSNIGVHAFKQFILLLILKLLKGFINAVHIMIDVLVVTLSMHLIGIRGPVAYVEELVRF